VTIAIFAVLFQRVPVGEVVVALGQIRLLPYLALMVPYSLVYCLVDAFVLTRVITWFHIPVAYRRILPVRAAAYILSLLNPGLGQGAVAFALHRREGIPLLELAGSLLFLVVLEFVQLALYAAVGVFVLHPHLAMAFAPIYMVLAGVLGLGLFYVHKGLTPLAPLLTWLGRRVRRDVTYRYHPATAPVGLLRAFRQARAPHYLLTLVFKAPNFVLAVLLHHLALQQFGVSIPVGTLFAFLPVVFLVASLPVTVAHLGTSQAAWVYFFAAYGDASRLLAYSLVAHVTFMLLNSVIGLGFLPAALRQPAAPVVQPDTEQPETLAP
jgi:hypothetical protein